MHTLVYLSGFVVLLWVALAVGLPRALRRMPLIATDAWPSPLPARVSVIVPARNEEAVLPRCLASLAAQDLPPLEVFVVDDDSTDDTSAVAERAGVKVILAPRRPDGWMGKPWAAWQAAQVARGDWLLFVDADVELAPEALRAALAVAQKRNVAMLTVMPGAVSSSTWEALIQPPLAILVLGHMDPRFVDNPKYTHATALGCFMLFRREAYESVGGHAAVRDQLMEDYKLALRTKARGLPICVVNAAHLVRLRRRQTLGELWNTWCRVFSGGLAGRRWLAVLGALYVAVGFSGPHAAAIWGLIACSAPIVWVLIGLAFIQTCATLVIGRMLGMDARFVALEPVGALFTAAALVRAALAPAGGTRIRWRGRVLKV